MIPRIVRESLGRARMQPETPQGVEGMTGLEIIKASTATAGEIADIISQPCPPVIPETCDRLSCRECWLTCWSRAGQPPSLVRASHPRGEGKKRGTRGSGTPGLGAALRFRLRRKGQRKRYSSGALAGYIGKKVLIKHEPETVTARNWNGDFIGVLTPLL